MRTGLQCHRARTRQRVRHPPQQPCLLQNWYDVTSDAITHISLNSMCIFDCMFTPCLSPQLHVSPTMSQHMYSVCLTRVLSAGGPAMALRDTSLLQPGSMVTPTCVTPTPPPAPGTTCTVESGTLLRWGRRITTAPACPATALSSIWVRFVPGCNL